jgi:hypothetical protein
VASLVSIVLLSVFLVAALSFGAWAFMGRQDYKNNVDAKIKTAIQANTKVVQAKDAADYAEAAKNPLKSYTGPEAYGSVALQYPKTWSGYVVTGTGQPLDAYFNPDVVPSVSDQKSVFALRVQVVASSYTQTLAQFQGLLRRARTLSASSDIPPPV